MKHYFWTFLLITTLGQVAYPCSSFVLKKGKSVLLGKNFDWTFDQGFLVKNLRNTPKVAYFTQTGTPASWKSKFGSISFNQNGKEMPYGGMNEKGLVVEMLWLEETRFNISEDKTYLNELEWIQYQLDNFQTIDEVIAHVENLKICPIKGKIHYLLADPLGKSVIIEYLDGKPKLIEKGTNICQAITNKSVAYSEKYKENIGEIPKKNTSEMYRYYQLESQIKNLQNQNDFSEKTAFQMLKSVQIPKGDFKTVWSIVYNLENKSVSFFSQKHKKIKHISLNAIDFDRDCSILDINQDKETILDQKLEPISEQKNLELVSVSLRQLGFEKDFCSDLSSHQLNQKLADHSYFSQNYFHFDISIPVSEAGKRLLFALMDSEENFKKRIAVAGGFAIGTTSIGAFNRHIYGLKNGRYAMIALIDDNKNSKLDFDGQGNPIEKYATFSDFIPKSMEEITFENTSGYFDKDNAKRTIRWK